MRIRKKKKNYDPNNFLPITPSLANAYLSSNRPIVWIVINELLTQSFQTECPVPKSQKARLFHSLLRTSISALRARFTYLPHESFLSLWYDNNSQKRWIKGTTASSLLKITSPRAVRHREKASGVSLISRGEKKIERDTAKSFMGSIGCTHTEPGLSGI